MSNLMLANPAPLDRDCAAFQALNTFCKSQKISFRICPGNIEVVSIVEEVLFHIRV